jgi:hypothetical protein
MHAVQVCGTHLSPRTHALPTLGLRFAHLPALVTPRGRALLALRCSRNNKNAMITKCFHLFCNECLKAR